MQRAVTDGTLDAGGMVTGVIPKFMVDKGWCYDRLEDVIITADGESVGSFDQYRSYRPINQHVYTFTVRDQNGFTKTIKATW